MPCKWITQLLTAYQPIAYFRLYTVLGHQLLHTNPWTEKQNNEDQKWVTGNCSATYCFLNMGDLNTKVEWKSQGADQALRNCLSAGWGSAKKRFFSTEIFKSKVNTSYISLQNPFPSRTQDWKLDTDDKSSRKYSEIQINKLFNEEITKAWSSSSDQNA